MLAGWPSLKEVRVSRGCCYGFWAGTRSGCFSRGFLGGAAWFTGVGSEVCLDGGLGRHGLKNGFACVVLLPVQGPTAPPAIPSWITPAPGCGRLRVPPGTASPRLSPRTPGFGCDRPDPRAASSSMRRARSTMGHLGLSARGRVSVPFAGARVLNRTFRTTSSSRAERPTSTFVWSATLLHHE